MVARGSLDAHIAVVPGLIADAGDIRLIGGVALYKPIFMGVLAEPGILLGALEAAVGLRGDIEGQAGLVLAGPGLLGFAGLALGVEKILSSLR